MLRVRRLWPLFLVYNAGGSYGATPTATGAQKVSDNNSMTAASDTGGGAAHNNMQPSLVLLYCKKS